MKDIVHQTFLNLFKQLCDEYQKSDTDFSFKEYLNQENEKSITFINSLFFG